MVTTATYTILQRRENGSTTSQASKENRILVVPCTFDTADDVQDKRCTATALVGLVTATLTLA